MNILRTYWAVNSYNDSPFLFQEETEYIIELLLKHSDISEEDIRLACYRNYEGINRTLVLPSLLMYKETLELSSKADMKAVYKGLGYEGIMQGVGSASLRVLTVQMLQLRIVAHLNKMGLSITATQEGSPLFSPVSMISDSQMPFMIQDDSGEEQTEILAEILDQLVSRVPFRNAKSRRKPTPVKRIRRVKEKAPNLKTLLSRMEMNGCAQFSAYWMSPPPISPEDLSDLTELPPVEQAFLLDLFLDVYRTESLLLSVYFLMRRVRELWTRDSGCLISEAPYRPEERKFLGYVLDGLSSELYERATTKVLAVEGISISSDSFRKAVLESEGVVLDVLKAADALLSIVRDAALCTGRIRVSLLYGASHPSYVGDLFLSSTLDTYDAYVRSGGSLNAAGDIIPVAASISLAEDEISMHETLESFCARLPVESRKRKLEEPKSRRFYQETSLVGLRLAETLSVSTNRTSLSGEGPLDSLRTEEESPLLGILKKYWGSIYT